MMPRSGVNCHRGQVAPGVIVLLMPLVLLCLLEPSSGTMVPFPEKFVSTYHQQDIYEDYRITTYSELSDDPEVSFYVDRDVESYSKIVVDTVRQQVIVGAMNYLLRLDLADLHMIEKVAWFPSNISHSICQAKGKPPEDCNNYIRVLLTHEQQIFACGTNAFSPQCTWRPAKQISTITESVTGVGTCPYDPHNNNTALLSHAGDIYVGTEMDYIGRDPAIYRIMGPSSKLRTVRRNLKWLNEPEFVSSYEIGDFIYIFFREEAMENSCSQNSFSRVARICKHDSGGDFLLEDNWTSFLKARLTCSVPSNKTVFHYDELQHTYYEHHSKLIYATFTTSRPSLHGSAVCVYNMSDITQVFNGGFLYQARNDDAWTMQENNAPNQQCSSSHSTTVSHSQLMNAQRYQLMQEHVQPVNYKPLYEQPEQRWTHIVSDSVYLHHTRQHLSVVFVTTLEGAVHKILELSATQSCLIEVVYLTPIGEQTKINTMHILRDKGVLLIGTKDELLRVPVQRCARFTTQSSCLGSMDPYCGWDSHGSVCSTSPQDTPRHNWHQNIISCPVIDVSDNEDWSDWSVWKSCERAHTHTNTHSSTQNDVCMCRKRVCNRSNFCEGHDTQVTNCTVHGAWSTWSDWGTCSSTCGNAVQQRSRGCNAPAPEHGGRLCVGRDLEERDCEYVPCIEPRIAPLEVDGGWSPWMEWSGCSRPCGGGIKKRYRLCNQPPPSLNGKMCAGNSEQWSACNTRMCQEHRRTSSWTPWLKTNVTDMGFTEERFKCVCKANVPEERYIRTDIRSDSRYCAEEGRCNVPGINKALWGAWSPWSNCESGVQWRHRTCDSRGPQCEGPTEQRQECPMSTGQWSCWSDFSACSMSCGQGLKIRERTCQSSDNGRSYNVHCNGNNVEEQPCVMPACTINYGWDSWSLWSVCEQNNLQQRKRICGTKHRGILECVGPEQETRMCTFNSLDMPTVLMTQSSRPISVRIYHLIIVGILAFLLGGFVFVAFLIYCRRVRTPPVVIANDHNGYPPAYAPASYDDMKYDQSKAAPNEYMSPAQLSPTSSAGKYNQQAESPQHNPHHNADIIRDPYPYRNTRSRQARHNGELSRSPSSYSHTPSYSASSVNSPSYSRLNMNSFYDGGTSPRSPVSESFSTMSLSRYKDPRYRQMTVKEAKEAQDAIINRNSLMRNNSSLMRTHKLPDDRL